MLTFFYSMYTAPSSSAFPCWNKTKTSISNKGESLSWGKQKHKTKTDQELERTSRKISFLSTKSMFCISGGYPKLNPFQLSLKKSPKTNNNKKPYEIPAVFLKVDIPVFWDKTWISISTGNEPMIFLPAKHQYILCGFLYQNRVEIDKLGTALFLFWYFHYS